MLTENQYNALCIFRDNFVPASGKPDDMTMRFLEYGYIETKRFEYTVQDECEVTYLKTVWSLTVSGQEALEEFEYIVEKSRKEKADKEAEKKSDRRFQLLTALFGAVIGYLLAFLVEHWNSIINFALKFFH